MFTSLGNLNESLLISLGPCQLLPGRGDSSVYLLPILQATAEAWETRRGLPPLDARKSPCGPGCADMHRILSCTEGMGEEWWGAAAEAGYL